MSEFYDRKGKPIDLMKWCELFEARFRGDKYYLVAISRGCGYEVSTVWLGVDHAFGHGPPLIFETMIFVEGTGPPRETLPFQTRYTTEEEALEGHRQAVDWLRQRLGEEGEAAAFIPPQVIRGELES